MKRESSDDFEILRIMAVAGESSIEYFHISGCVSHLPGFSPLPNFTPDLRQHSDESTIEADDHSATTVERGRPIYCLAVIEQDHPLHVPHISHDVTSKGKPGDDAWFIIPPSLGGRPVPWNLRPIHNNGKGKQFGNLMMSKCFEVMIQLWLEGMPSGSAFVKYQVSLEYNTPEYPERPDGFTYLIQFYKSQDVAPRNEKFYSVIAETACRIVRYGRQKNPLAYWEHVYNLPSDWLLQDSEVMSPSELIRVTGVMNKAKFEYLRISTNQFLSGKGIDRIPEYQPKLCDSCTSVLKLGANTSPLAKLLKGLKGRNANKPVDETTATIVTEGDDISHICLLAPDLSIEQSRILFDSWMYLRIMIERWLRDMPSDSSPSVTFQISGEILREVRFSAQFYARTTPSHTMSEELGCILSKIAIEWLDYVESLHEDPQWRNVSLPTKSSQAAKKEKKRFIDSTPILDVVPVVGGVMDFCRGVRDLKDKKVAAGLLNIGMGVGNVAIDVAGLGLSSIPKQAVKPFIKSVSKRFAGMFAKTVGFKILRTTVDKLSTKK